MMVALMTRNGLVRFRKLRASDARQLQKFINKLIQEDTFLLASGRLYSLGEETKLVREWVKKTRGGHARYIVAERNDEIVGVADLNRMTPRFPRQRHVGIFGVAVAKEFRGAGVGELLSRLVLGHAKRMRMRMVTLTVFAENAVARRLYRKLGFVEYGILPGAMLRKGKYVAQAMMYKVIG